MVISGFRAFAALGAWTGDGLYFLSADKNSQESSEFLSKVFPYLAARGFDAANIKQWDLNVNSDEITRFMAKYANGAEPPRLPILVAVPASGKEVEIWNLDWLKHAERADVCYPVSGGWWSVDGDWNPSLKKVKNHLYESPNHEGGNFFLLWLDQLNFEELQSLHSDHHREMTNEGSVNWKKVNRECPR